MVITTGTITTIQLRPINGQERLIIQSDADFSESVARETVKFLLSRHASSETLDDVNMHIETLSENFMERIFNDRMREDY